jgi:transcriptional regulator with XRE-family HTH domain
MIYSPNMARRKPHRRPVNLTSSPLSSLIYRRGFTHRRLAEKVGVDRTYISHMVTGKRAPSMRRAVLIARVLGISLDRFQKVLKEA